MINATVVKIKTSISHFFSLQVCDKENLQLVDFFTEKIIQTFEMMIVRHGYVTLLFLISNLFQRLLHSSKFTSNILVVVFSSFMMVGDPFASKTSVLMVLAQTLNLLFDRKYDDENVNKVSAL